MPKKDEPESPLVIQEKFSFEQRDSKRRLIARSGMSGIEILLRKVWRRIQDAFAS